MTIGMEWDDWEWRVVDSDFLPSHPMRGSEMCAISTVAEWMSIDLCAS